MPFLMQKSALLFALLLAGLASAQKSRPLFSNSDHFAPISFTFGFQKFENLQTLTRYSPTAMVTHKYIPTGAGYLRTDTAPLPATLNGIIVDSFNPSGAKNMQTAIGMGLVRTIFKL